MTQEFVIGALFAAWGVGLLVGLFARLVLGR